jgi:hypothetical protein
MAEAKTIVFIKLLFQSWPLHFMGLLEISGVENKFGVQPLGCRHAGRQAEA